MASLYTIKGILILDNDGNRVVCKYFDENKSALKDQKVFEKKLFEKTSRSNSEIVMFDGITCVYKSNIDLFFYVYGSSSENELLLANVLNTYYEAIAMILRDQVERSMLLDQMDAVLLITDEIVDGGIVLETDAVTLAKNATRKKSESDSGKDQSFSSALNKASGLLRKHLLQ
eukprot:m.14931 g.14931  ORF g.14931 m.14931 type:complete len:173 (-) comp10379_c0_seq1:165-683(-)